MSVGESAAARTWPMICKSMVSDQWYIEDRCHIYSKTPGRGWVHVDDADSDQDGLFDDEFYFGSWDEAEAARAAWAKAGGIDAAAARAPSDTHVQVTDAELRMLLGTFPRTAAYPSQALEFAERWGVPLINDLAKAREDISRLESELACIADVVNSWCREVGGDECKTPYAKLTLRNKIDDLWGHVNGMHENRIRDLQAKLDAAIGQ